MKKKIGLMICLLSLTVSHAYAATTTLRTLTHPLTHSHASWIRFSSQGIYAHPTEDVVFGPA